MHTEAHILGLQRHTQFLRDQLGIDQLEIVRIVQGGKNQTQLQQGQVLTRTVTTSLENSRVHVAEGVGVR